MGISVLLEVLNHARRLEDFVAAADGIDFIIGEDMADTDLLKSESGTDESRSFVASYERR